MKETLCPSFEHAVMTIQAPTAVSFPVVMLYTCEVWTDTSIDKCVVVEEMFNDESWIIVDFEMNDGE